MSFLAALETAGSSFKRNQPASAWCRRSELRQVCESEAVFYAGNLLNGVIKTVFTELLVLDIF